MNRSLRSYSNNTVKSVKSRYRLFLLFLIAGFMLCEGRAFGVDRDNVRIKVVAANPSRTRDQEVPVKIYLPQEINPEDIVSKGGLEIGYDNEKAAYYVYRNSVPLKPKEIRVFEVEVKDVWFIPEERIATLHDHTQLILNLLQDGAHAGRAKDIAGPLVSNLQRVAKSQADESIGRRERIGLYRNNLKLMELAERDLAKLQNLITIAQSLPVPEVLEKPKIKTDAPSKTTTWMIIFIIITFIGMLASVFFFTWHTQAHFTKDFITGVRKIVFGKGADIAGSGEARPEK